MSIILHHTDTTTTLYDEDPTKHAWLLTPKVPIAVRVTDTITIIGKKYNMHFIKQYYEKKSKKYETRDQYIDSVSDKYVCFIPLSVDVPNRFPENKEFIILRIPKS